MIASPHSEAIAAISTKPVVIRQVFDGLLPELRGRAFTITGLQSAEIVQRVRDAIATLPNGALWDDVKAEVSKELDPWLGDEQRAEILLRTHAYQAYQAANWRVAQADGDTTHLQYLATEDDHVRPTHLALNGLVLPKDDEFWKTHFPPWEWGCRCSVRPMNPDLVDEARKADEDYSPENKLVLEGPAHDQLENGTLIRDLSAPPFDQEGVPDDVKKMGRFDVTPPAERDGANAFQWHPDNLRLPLAQLEVRYEPEAWRVFEAFAKNTQLEPGLTLWDWLQS